MRNLFVLLLVVTVFFCEGYARRDCPSGDEDWRYCTLEVSADPSLCYLSSTQKICCTSCATHHTGRYECAYGDRNVTYCHKKVSADSTVCYEPSTEVFCCASCHSQQSDTKGCEYGDRDSAYCLANLYITKCYDDPTKSLCCSSCRNKTTGIVGCEFGDKNPAYCIQAVRYDRAKCYRTDFQDMCCASCKKGRPDCEYGDKYPNYCEGKRGSSCCGLEEDCCDTCRYSYRPCGAGGSGAADQNDLSWFGTMTGILFVSSSQLILIKQ